MIVAELILNEHLEETIRRTTEIFPHSAYYEDMSLHPGGYVPWHWHPDVEFTALLQGAMRLSTNNRSFVIKAGEGAFVNSNVLHYKESLPGGNVIALTQVFDAQLLYGAHKSVFEQKYVAPVIECKELEAMHLLLSEPNQRRMLELLKSSYDAADREAYGYEFAVRNDLSEVWRLLCQEAEDVLRSKKVVMSQSEERIKKMMLFIQEHFEDKLSLEEIAASANISGRECLRCFQQNLNTTPFTYLLEYRVRRATGMLRETDLPVTEIAYACGFSGTSYFGKIFKKFMKCTPSQYRRLEQETAKTNPGAKTESPENGESGRTENGKSRRQTSGE